MCLARCLRRNSTVCRMRKITSNDTHVTKPIRATFEVDFLAVCMVPPSLAAEALEPDAFEWPEPLFDAVSDVAVGCLVGVDLVVLVEFCAFAVSDASATLGFGKSLALPINTGILPTESDTPVPLTLAVVGMPRAV